MGKIRDEVVISIEVVVVVDHAAEEDKLEVATVANVAAEGPDGRRGSAPGVLDRGPGSNRWCRSSLVICVLLMGVELMKRTA